ncbi:unnamed protein product [Paramecium sonneborni]|uniref:Uncharacterized protein n=1 Tax=Paramecium sonneborni TaxID=65129 RepID=A0A8S1RSS8_9CILI|nr:unnamed protein product [Paramecium sonneborni]
MSKSTMGNVHFTQVNAKIFENVKIYQKMKNFHHLLSGTYQMKWRRLCSQK